MPVHPQVVQYLEQIANYDLPSFDEMTPELIRSTLTPSPEPHIPAKSIENLTLSINKAENTNQDLHSCRERGRIGCKLSCTCLFSRRWLGDGYIRRI